MLAGAYNLLYGTVFAGPATLGVSRTGKGEAGVQVQRYQSGVATPIATTTTDANGQYSFAVNAVGTYSIKEVVPNGQKFSDSLASSQVFNVSGSHTNALQVTVPSLTSSWEQYDGVVQSSEVGMTVEIGTDTFETSVGLLMAGLGTAQRQTNLDPGFQTFCVNPLDSLSFAGGESFKIEPQPLSELVDSAPVSTDRSARIAYLVDTYSSQHLTNVQAAGLQLAIWELEEDTSPTANFSTGKIKVLGPIDPADAAARHRGRGAGGHVFQPVRGGHEQSGRAAERHGDEPNELCAHRFPIDGGHAVVRLREHHRAAAAAAADTGHVEPLGLVYCDVNLDGIKEANEMGVPGIAVTLTGTDVNGKAVHTTVITSATNRDSTSSPTSLLAHIQSWKEPPGYTYVDQTQGTPGTGIATTRQFVNIKLAAGVNGQNNNFGEIMPPVNYSVQLSGIHMQQSVITLTLTGWVNPATVTNTKNYRLVGLNGPNTGAIPIASATYNAATHQVILLPAYHINIHHDYEITAVFPASSCTPASIYSKIFGGYYHQVMIPVANPVILPPATTTKKA